MFPELKALIAVADTGSMDRAANQLSLTPSALTRRIQRLEDELGGVLLDRCFKPPKLTRAGLEILDKSRTILASLGDLRSFACGDAPPVGPFRLGLSHAVAQPDISPVIVRLSKRYPQLQPSISNDLSCQLLERMRLGHLDGAVVVLPEATSVPGHLEGVTLVREEMRPIQARNPSGRNSARCKEFYRGNWVLNPLGCLVREEIKKRVEGLGVPLRVAAELHNPGLQLSLIAGNVGVGMVRTSFLRKHPLRSRVSFVEHADFNISVRVVFLRARHLGTRHQVALELQRLLLKHLGGNSSP